MCAKLYKNKIELILFCNKINLRNNKKWLLS